jgi:hypothetical protein
MYPLNSVFPKRKSSFGLFDFGLRVLESLKGEARNGLSGAARNTGRESKRRKVAYCRKTKDITNEINSSHLATDAYLKIKMHRIMTWQISI